jgi:hypothetical protein
MQQDENNKIIKLEKITEDVKKLEQKMQELALPCLELHINDRRVSVNTDLFLSWDGERIKLTVVPRKRDENTRPLLDCKACHRLIAGDHLFKLLEESITKNTKRTV